MGGVVSGIGDAISGAVSGVGDFVGQAAQDIGTGLASVDKGVNEIPGGWGTVAGLAAGGAGLYYGGAAAAAGGLTEMAAADMAGLIASGVGESQAASIIAGSYGLDAMVAADMAGLASQGLGASQIASTVGASYGGDILAAAATSAGVTPSSIMGLVQKYGPTVAKSLLGSATGSQKTAGGLFGGTSGGLLGAAGNYALSGYQLGQLQNAYGQNVAAQQAATQQAQQQASFTPVGMTTAFGQSNFQFDPATGKLTSAGYTPTSQVAGQVQNLFGLGAGALPTTTDTQAVQQNYIAQQQGLLAPGREQQLAQLRNRQYQRGTTGLATGGTMAGYAPNAQGLMATNPETAAYYNALAQQDAQLAANAPTYAQNLLNAQIATGTGLFGAANTLEGYAQQPLSLSTALGTAGATAGAKAGYYGLLGNQAALQTQLQGQQANIYGVGQQISTAANPLLTAAGGVVSEWLK